MASFEEFCGLMWLLHVRDALALSSKKYKHFIQHVSLVRSNLPKQAFIVVEMSR